MRIHPRRAPNENYRNREQREKMIETRGSWTRAGGGAMSRPLEDRLDAWRALQTPEQQSSVDSAQGWSARRLERESDLHVGEALNVRLLDVRWDCHTCRCCDFSAVAFGPRFPDVLDLFSAQIPTHKRRPALEGTEPSRRTESDGERLNRMRF